MSGRPPAHWGIFGASQSGKTLWLKRRLVEKPRWIVLDADHDVDRYDELSHARTAWGVEELVEEVRRRARKRPSTWRLSYRARSPGEYLAGARALWSLHRRLELETTLVVVEEAHRLLEGRNLPPELRKIYFRGLKRRLVAVAVSQNVQQVPAQVRHNSDRQVYFRTIGRLPEDVRKNLDDRAGDVRSLEPLTPAYQARRDVHYVFHPEHLDLAKEWGRV